jgi:Holliday junction resolvasome RuvABC endonuclease subunit
VIVGLDTASNRWHAVCEDGTIGCCPELKGKAWQDPDVRRAELARTFTNWLANDVLSATEPESCWIFCEEPLALQNGKTTRLLSLAAGALWDVGRLAGVEWVWIDVAAWKRVIVGNGNADKAKIAAHVIATYGVGYSEPDHYDAHALMEAGKRVIETGKPITAL